MYMVLFIIVVYNHFSINSAKMKTTNLPVLNNAKARKEAKERKDAMIPTKCVMEVAKWEMVLVKWAIVVTKWEI